MILIAFRYGLHAAELCDLRWDQIDFDGAASRPVGQERALGPTPQSPGDLRP